MGKVIEFPGNKGAGGQKGKSKKKPPQAVNPLTSQADVVYMDALIPLVEMARELANEYGYPTKDVLTDAIVLDVRDSMLSSIRNGGYDDGGGGYA